MTIEQAIEIVESRARAMEDWAAKVPTSEMGIDAEALRLVLARAKEPRVYALGEGEREALKEILEVYNQTITKYIRGESEMKRALRQARALTAALNLQQPQTTAEGEQGETKWK